MISPLACVLAAAFFVTPQAPAPEPSPGAVSASESAPLIVREITLEGATFFTREQILKALRLQEGARFRRDPAEVAASLVAHYEAQCFMAVRVDAAFDPASGRLRLAVDEGRMHALRLAGLSAEDEARVRELLSLPEGVLLREKEVREAIQRLEASSAGAYRVRGGTPWPVDTTGDGPVLRLQVDAPRFRVHPQLAGPDASPFYTRVEGNAPGMGLEAVLFDRSSFHHLYTYARAAYGFASEDVRYALGARRAFGPGPRGRVTLGYERHDMTDTDDGFRGQLLAQPRGIALPAFIAEDYFRRRGHEAYAFVHPTPRLHLGASFRSDTHESMPVVADDALIVISRPPRVNPPVDEGLMRSALVTARYAAREPLFHSAGAERDSFLVRSPYGDPFQRGQGVRAEATFEWASPDLGGDYDFRRLVAHVRGARQVATRHTLTWRGLVGLGGGDLPYQRRMFLGGAGSLRGYSLKEFAGTSGALASAEWMVQPPSPRLPALIAFADAGRVWGRALDDGVKADVGLGLEWPSSGRPKVRVDAGVPLQRRDGQDPVRVYGSVRWPF